MVLFYANRPGDPGIVLWEVAAAALCFEVLYRSFGVLFRVLAARQGVALDRKRRPTFARDGNSYAVSFVHAFVVVWRGVPAPHPTVGSTCRGQVRAAALRL